MKGKSHLRFRTLAPRYDLGVRILGLCLGGERFVRGKALNLLPLEHSARVLEVGCGTGTVTLMASDRVGPAGRVIGIDPSPEMLVIAKEKISHTTASNTSFICGPGAPLPFPDGHFTAVIFFLVLHEMTHEDRLDSLKEAVRVLRCGGHLLVADLGRPQNLFGRLILRLLLLVEEEEATDFLVRGLPAVIDEGTGGSLTEVQRVSFALGIGHGVLYVKGETV